MPAFGSHVPQARLSGAWKNWSKFFARHNGSWKRPVSVHVKSSGSWVKVYDERPTVTSVSTNLVDDGEVYFAYKYGVVSANGFAVTVTSNANNGFSPTSISVDNTTGVTAVNIINYWEQIVYPTVTVTNASGSVTF